MLAIGVVGMSVSFALGNVPLNVQTVVIERRMGRTVVPQFHAAFSIGSVLGSGLGALAAWGHLPLVVQFALVAVGSLVWRLRSIPSAVLSAPDADRAPAPVAADAVPGVALDEPLGDVPTRSGGMREAMRAWRDPRTLVLGVVVMAGGLSEGTANNWLAIGVVDGFRAREAVGALVFAVFVASMTVARVSGTRLIDRFGRVRVLLVSTSTAVVGLVGFALAPSLPFAVVGALAWGLGAGLVVPIGMAAVTGHGPGAAGRVAVVSAFASIANLVAPPVIGLVAEGAGVRHAVLAVAGVMIVGVLLSRRIADPGSAQVPAPVPMAVGPRGRRAMSAVPAERGAPAGAAWAVFVTFVLNGFAFASLASRLPAVRDALGLLPEQVGLLLLGVSSGALVAMPLSGVVVQRLGATRTILGFAAVNGAGLLIASAGVAAGRIWVVVPALVLVGMGTGVWDAAMNLEGAAVEQRLGRAIMPRFHAGFSVGTMVGAAIGAVAARLHAPLLVHLGIVLPLGYLALVVCSRWFLPEGTHDVHPDDAGERPRSAWRESRTVLIGLVVLAAALTEGSANDWVSLAVVDGFGVGNDVGALGFGLFVTAMTAMRLLGTGLLDRFGRVVVLRIVSGLSLFGLLVFGLAPVLWLAAIGVVLWGMGAALGFPVGMSAASDDPRRAPARVAVVATIGYSAFLAGPPLIGLLAGHLGYRHALLAVAIPVVVGLLVIPAARPLPTAAGSAR